ncbi:MAG: hypothetical protein K6F27_14575, partial [Ruminococcus sp.]|nr:hypothetical protein [Ruminococcus sp.]
MRYLFSANGIGERGKLTGQMAVRKPYFSGKASIAGGSPPPTNAGSGRTPDPPHNKKERSDEMRTRDVTITVRCTKDE